MGMITTTSVLPAPVQQRFDMKLLSRVVPECIHNVMALKKRLPERSGSILRMRRYNNLQTATVPLGPSGLNPPAQTLSALDIDAKVNWYGTYVLITDQVSLINEDPVLNETASLLAQSLNIRGLSKLLVIDLEAYSESQGDKGQAVERLAA
jgi:N4-gp56 family major capsid protein